MGSGPLTSQRDPVLFFDPFSRFSPFMASLHFKALCHSWVALHAKPKGVIQFIGGAFFGTFAPTLFYRHLLQFFFDQSYSIIIYPFNFSFNHYKESFFLLREQYALAPALMKLAAAQGDDPLFYLESKNYIWFGHSIGCKYVALLEAADQLPEEHDQLRQHIAKILERPLDQEKNVILVDRVARQLEHLIEDVKRESMASQAAAIDLMTRKDENAMMRCQNTSLIYANLYIKDQTSVLLAPVTSDTSSAVRPKAFAEWLDRRGWGVEPTAKVTRNLIQESNLFNLLVLAEFQADQIAKETIQWFYTCLEKPAEPDRRRLAGGHLRPLGFSLGQSVINPWFDLPFITSIRARNQAFEELIGRELQAILNHVTPTLANEQPDLTIKSQIPSFEGSSM
jgi:hypothetical protein